MKAELFPPQPVLIVDDEANALKSFEIVLYAGGITNVVTCQDSREVAGLLAQRSFEMLLLDLTMPHISGEKILDMVAADFPDIPVIIITCMNDIDTAVRCIKAGAVDYMVKPVEKSRLLAGVRRIVELQELRRQNLLLKQQILGQSLHHPEYFAAIRTHHPDMFAIFRYIEAVARSFEPVLITGETGVGKELIARTVHTASGRAGRFVPVNVAGLDDNMFTDTLFGHKKGAFTDASQARTGLLEQAAGGTLFLDEIGDLSPASQVKLLRLLQENEYYPLGSDLPRRSDARVVVATNQNLEEAQLSGRFRKDLYYRIRVHHIRIPPLRDRLCDLSLLLDLFLDEAAAALNKKRPTPPPELLTLLATYHFPGNVRELRAMVFDAVSRHEAHKLSLHSFKAAIGGQRSDLPIPDSSFACVEEERPVFARNRLPTLKQCESYLIQEALARSGGNQSIAADMLGISRQALNKRLKGPGEGEK